MTPKQQLLMATLPQRPAPKRFPILEQVQALPLPPYDGPTTQEHAHGICEHCFKFRTVYFDANENGEPVTAPICAACQEN